MERKPILDIRIEFNGAPVHMKGENAEVLMIPFKGSVDCALFHGVVEPCGVDTQIVNAAGVRHMSARYMLTGKDPDGRDAHIYIENNGWFDERVPFALPFRTVPTFHTDSPRLAPYLHAERFEGEGVEEPDGLHIRFYELSAPAEPAP